MTPAERLGGIAATPEVIPTDVAPAPDPVAAILDPRTTLVVADGSAALGALARAFDVTLVLRDDPNGIAGAIGAAVTQAAPPIVSAARTGARIREIRIHRIALPLRDLYVSAMYLTDKQTRTLVEMHLDDGSIGWGETNGTPDCAARVTAVARDWIGRCAVADRAALRRKFARIGFDNRHGRNGLAAFAAVDLAAWDAAARHLQQPFAAMLGAPQATRPLPIACPLPAAVPGRLVTPAELAVHMADTANATRVADLAESIATAWGVTAFKYKSAASGAEWDLAALGALRARLPKARLRIDPNGAYATEAARRLCIAAEPLGIEFFEDPTDGLEGAARLAAQLHTPLATNMSIIAPEHIAARYRRGAGPNVVLGDLYYWGGVAGLRDMVSVARHCGLTPALHSFYETAIGTAANIHIAAALDLDTPHPMDCGWPLLAADIVAPDALLVQDGHIHPPQGIGLGIVPDPARLASLSTADVVILR